MREFEYIEGVGMTINNEAIQGKMKRCVDLMMAEHNRLEDEAVINALRSHGYEVVKWHPYPEEEPPRTDGYETTRMHPVMDESGKLRMQRVTMRYCYDKESKSWLRKGVPLQEGTILAWAEIPKPWRGEA